MRIPSLLLAKLYVKGTLHNEPNGFRLTLRNVLAPGTAVKLASFKVDGGERRLEDVSLVVDGQETLDAAAISDRTPLFLGLGRELVVRVRGEALAAGAHEILLSFVTREVGELTIPVRDTVGP